MDPALRTFRQFARYNTHANQRLYGACAALTDADRRLDRKGFFRSIHGTLNHIMVGDVATAEAMEVAGAITPVPGGVGPMTIACLLANSLTAAHRTAGLPDPEL